MQYKVGSIRKANIQPHDDIETAILTQQNGLLTFTIRINNGNIVDFNMVKYVNAKSYLTNGLLTQELSISQLARAGSGENPVRNNNGQRNA